MAAAANCTMCDGTGYKDHAGFGMDPCAHSRHWPVLLAIIGPLIDSPRAVEPGSLLADLGLDDLDRDVIAMELGDAIGVDFHEDVSRRWLTLSDILASAEGQG